MRSNEKIPYFKILLRAISIQYKAVPWVNTYNTLMGAATGLILMLSVMATQELFDSITRAVEGQIGFLECTISLLILAAIIIGHQIFNGIHNFLIDFMFTKSKGIIRTMLHHKLLKIDPSKFEDTKFLDNQNKAREGAEVIPHISSVSLMLLCFYGVYFVSAGLYLFRLKPILPIILIIAFIPALLAQIVNAKMFARLESESAPVRRENEYYKKTLCDREYFKETRILGAFRFFHKLFAETLELLTRKIWQAERKTALLQLALNATSFAGMAISVYLLFDATISGEITVGAFAAVFSALGTVFGLMQEAFDMQIGYLSKGIGKIANFFSVHDMPEREGTDGAADYSKGITAEHVSFTYPGRDEAAVRDVSLTLSDGETIAIVGENGAGKSTLVRLLTGIYNPSEGKVTVGGLDTATTAPASLFQDTSGVFQKYQRYKMTLCENVEISDVGTSVITNSKPLVEAALHDADFADESVALDTMLSPEFDGIDLSGGQWQRLAIARGLYRAHRFIVLDEPTAAIDPIEETKIYTQFQRLAKGKCAIVVTHRLGSAKLAHRIIVMDGGRIVDIGTHDELLAREGKYADMWKAQSKWYQRIDG